MLKRLTIDVLYNEYRYINRDFSEFDLTDSSNPAVQKLKEEIKRLIYKEKRLSYIKIPGLDLSDIPVEAFQDVIIESADLKNCKIRFNPQLLPPQDMYGCYEERRLVEVNLEGNDLSGMNFTEINIESTNLTDTGAVIELLSLANYFLLETKLAGCNIIGKPNNIFYSESTFSDEYKKQHPEYFLDENAPDELKEAFYGSSAWNYEIVNNIFSDYKYFLQGKNLKRFENGSPIVKVLNTVGWENTQAIISQYDDIQKALVDIDLLRRLMEDDERQFGDRELTTDNEYTKNLFVSQLPKEKQAELLSLARQYKPSYKSKIDIHPEITFGKEIEFVGPAFANVTKSLLEDPAKFGFSDWKCTVDGSVDGEVKSPPLYDSPVAWEQYRDVCQKIKESGGTIDSNCGGHIHFGASVLKNSPQKWLTLFKVWSTFEDVIFRLSGGEAGQIRGMSCAEPVSLYLNEFINGECEINSEDDIVKVAEAYGKYSNSGAHDQSLNLENVADRNEGKYTIEMRCFNGTLNPIQGQTNVLIGAGIVGAAIDIVDNPDSNKEKAELLEKHYQESIQQKNNFNEGQSMDKILAFADITCTNTEQKLRLLNLWDRTRDINLEQEYAKAAAKIKPKSIKGKTILARG